jgi:hypothetical protein
MATVYCNCDCINNQDGECQLDEIGIDKFGYCADCEDNVPPEPERPDKYYAIVRMGKEEACQYQERMGIKEIYRGRDIFLNYPNDDVFTDGRTGFLAKKKFLDTKTDEEMNKIFEELEQREGLTPLYEGGVL